MKSFLVRELPITDSLMRLPAVIGINPEDRKREERARSLDGCQDQLLAPMQEGKAFCPACGHIGERQGIQETALSVFTTVGAPVPLEDKPGRVSFHPSKVRIGICCFRSIPARVVERQRWPPLR